MTYDQAAQLRLLARAARAPAEPACLARLLLVASAHGGAGATSVAVLLAAALTAAKRRTLLIEAAAHSADAAAMCGLDGRGALYDVLSCRCTPAEAIATAAAGLRVLAAPQYEPEPPRVAEDAWPWSRMQVQLGEATDWVVVDCGRGFTPGLRALWRQAEHIFIVCTHDMLARLACYRLLKSVAVAGLTGTARLSHDSHWDESQDQFHWPRTAVETHAPSRCEAHLLVNRVTEPAAGTETCHRLRRMARRFLGMELGCGGSLPWDGSIHLAAMSGRLHDPAAVSAVTQEIIGSLVRQVCEVRGKQELWRTSAANAGEFGPKSMLERLCLTGAGWPVSQGHCGTRGCAQGRNFC